VQLIRVDELGTIPMHGPHKRREIYNPQISSQFIINNEVKLWKRQYFQKLAKPGYLAHCLIKSNPKLFQYIDQADQGTFYILYYLHSCRLKNLIKIKVRINLN
jgi:hypothetical protein